MAKLLPHFALDAAGLLRANPSTLEPLMAASLGLTLLLPLPLHQPLLLLLLLLLLLHQPILSHLFPRWLLFPTHPWSVLLAILELLRALSLRSVSSLLLIQLPRPFRPQLCLMP